MAVYEGKIDFSYIEEEYEKYKKKKYNFDVIEGILDYKKGIKYNNLLDRYNEVDMDKAIKLADIIFDNDIDKCFFLKQYLKLFNAEEEYVKRLVK